MLDLRMPIGIYFLLNAAILVCTGAISNYQSEIGTQKVNLDLIWGVVMGVFGAFMLGLSLLDKKKSKAE